MTTPGPPPCAPPSAAMDEATARVRMPDLPREFWIVRLNKSSGIHRFHPWSRLVVGERGHVLVECGDDRGLAPAWEWTLSPEDLNLLTQYFSEPGVSELPGGNIDLKTHRCCDGGPTMTDAGMSSIICSQGGRVRIISLYDGCATPPALARPLEILGRIQAQGTSR